MFGRTKNEVRGEMCVRVRSNTCTELEDAGSKSASTLKWSILFSKYASLDFKYLFVVVWLLQILIYISDANILLHKIIIVLSLTYTP
jgi:hypothetical protein